MIKLFINDWHTVMTYGIYKGKQILDIPKSYHDWILNNHRYGLEYEALVRIKNRRGITNIINEQDVQEYIPKMIEQNVLPIIERPKDIDSALFGSFIEYLVKYNLGLRKFDEVNQHLSKFGLVSVPKHLRLVEPILKPTKRQKYMAESLKKQIYEPRDICNLSFAHALELGSFDEEKAADLFRYILKNHSYFIEYSLKIQNCSILPKLTDSEQETCDKISVGCVIGEIDIIAGDCIVDIKCCQKDDIDYYRKQLFAYACLHRLRYGNKISYGKIFNFLTGKVYTINFQTITNNIAIDHVRNMGNHCIYHTKLFTD